MTETIRPDDSRVTRRCDGCGQIDDHPHHLREHDDGTSTSKHHDCCEADGCEVCADVNATHDGLTGDALVEHLTSGAVDHLTSTVEA
ncbi:MAG: hypothetical protein ACXVW0_07625 [Nocardioides sp.]